MRRSFTCALTLAALVGASSKARAQEVPPSIAPGPAAVAPPPAAVAPLGPGPAAPIAPPVWYPPPPPPVDMTTMRLMQYQQSEKSAALAVVLELLLPGAGSVYGGHPAGALVTWGGMIGGLVLAVEAFNPNGGSASQHEELGILAITAAVGFRIYGVVDACSSAQDYNAELARSLGLPIGVALAPVRTPHGTALAPTVTLRF